MSAGPATAQAQDRQPEHVLQPHHYAPHHHARTSHDAAISPKALRADVSAFASYPQTVDSDYPEVVDADYAEVAAAHYPDPRTPPGTAHSDLYLAEKQVLNAHPSPRLLYAQDHGLLSGDHAEPPRREARRWRRRKRVTWLVAVGAGVVVIAIVLGCVLGLVVFRRTDAGSDNTQPASPSAPPATMPSGTSKCTASAVCAAQGVAAVAGGDDRVHLFARAPDSSWKQASSSSASASDGSYGGWTSRGGSFDGAPAAFAWTSAASSWGGGATVSLLGVSPSSRRVVVKHIGLRPPDGAAAVAATGFVDLGGPDGVPVEPPTLCSPRTGRVDVWMRGGGGAPARLMHKPVDKEADWEAADRWETTGAGDLVPSSRYGVVCRDSDSFHDLVVYANGTGGAHSAWHRQYVTPAWRDWTDLGGDYAAGTDPVLVEVSTQRFDFFGLGRDSRMYHWSWSAGSGYSKAESLGGDTFASVPAVALSGAKKDRVEVVAVGKDDGKLKHLGFAIDALAASAAKWEDLGVMADSAPSLVRNRAGDVEVVMTAVDGSVWHATSSGGWDKLAWRPIPGL